MKLDRYYICRIIVQNLRNAQDIVLQDVAASISPHAHRRSCR